MPPRDNRHKRANNDRRVERGTSFIRQHKSVLLLGINEATGEIDVLSTMPDTNHYVVIQEIKDTTFASVYSDYPSSQQLCARLAAVALSMQRDGDGLPPLPPPGSSASDGTE